MNLLKSTLLIAVISSCCGCSLCAPGYLDDYGAVGGKWTRSNPTTGRVGSILSGDAGLVSEADEVYLDESFIEGDQEVYYDDYSHDGETYYESPSDEGVIILGEDW